MWPGSRWKYSAGNRRWAAKEVAVGKAIISDVRSRPERQWHCASVCGRKVRNSRVELVWAPELNTSRPVTHRPIANASEKAFEATEDPFCFKSRIFRNNEETSGSSALLSSSEERYSVGRMDGDNSAMQCNSDESPMWDCKASAVVKKFIKTWRAFNEPPRQRRRALKITRWVKWFEGLEPMDSVANMFSVWGADCSTAAWSGSLLLGSVVWTPSLKWRSVLSPSRWQSLVGSRKEMVNFAVESWKE